MLIEIRERGLKRRFLLKCKCVKGFYKVAGFFAAAEVDAANCQHTTHTDHTLLEIFRNEGD